MKLVLALIFMTSPAFAALEVYETAKGSATVNSVTLSSTSATQVDGAARRLRSRFAIEIFNDDSTNNLHCAFSSLVSTISTAGSVDANYGRKIPAGSSWTVAVPDAVSVWCKAAAATVLAVITQLH